MIEASALLAYLQAESGVAVVANVLTPGRYVVAAEEDDVPFEKADGRVVGEVGETV
jgi:PIN domain nuclease of toxin-antitoxin system